jgi:ribosomal protein S18 acetylase RimI-like enzyme
MRLLEAMLASMPPAESLRVGAWRLRRGGGTGRLAAFACLEGTPAAGAADLDAAIACFADRGERPAFLLDEAEALLDTRLAATGFGREGETLLLEARAAAIAAPAPGMAVIDCAAPIGVMREIWVTGGLADADLAGMARVGGPKLYLLGRIADRPAGAAFVSLHDDVGVLRAVHVLPAFRRRGLGTHLVRAAAHWARAQGGGRLLLAVEAEYAAARALSERLGMTVAARCHLRVGPPPRKGEE